MIRPGATPKHSSFCVVNYWHCAIVLWYYVSIVYYYFNSKFKRNNKSSHLDNNFTSGALRLSKVLKRCFKNFRRAHKE